MKRGFLLHNRKPDRSAVSQRGASTSPPSPEIAMTAHAAMVQHASALAFLTREPAVLWLCRHQESNDAVQYFQKEVQDSEDRLTGYIMELLGWSRPMTRPPAARLSKSYVNKPTNTRNTYWLLKIHMQNYRMKHNYRPWTSLYTYCEPGQ